MRLSFLSLKILYEVGIQYIRLCNVYVFHFLVYFTLFTHPLFCPVASTHVETTTASTAPETTTIQETTNEPTATPAKSKTEIATVRTPAITFADIKTKKMPTNNGHKTVTALVPEEESGEELDVATSPGSTFADTSSDESIRFVGHTYPLEMTTGDLKIKDMTMTYDTEDGATLGEEASVETTQTTMDEDTIMLSEQESTVATGTILPSSQTTGTLMDDDIKTMGTILPSLQKTVNTIDEDIKTMGTILPSFQTTGMTMDEDIRTLSEQESSMTTFTSSQTTQTTMNDDIRKISEQESTIALRIVLTS